MIKKITTFLFLMFMSLNAMKRPDEWERSFLRRLPLELIQEAACFTIRGSRDLNETKENYIKLVRGYTGEFDSLTQEDVKLFAKCLQHSPLFIAKKLNLDDVHKELFKTKYPYLSKLDKWLLDNELDSNLFSAVRFNNKELVEILLEAGANPNYTTPIENTTFNIAVIGNSDKEIIELLLKFGANPNVPDIFGKTILREVVEQNNKELVELLLKYKADPNSEDVVKFIKQKADQIDPEIVKLLKEAAGAEHETTKED